MTFETAIIASAGITSFIFAYLALNLNKDNVYLKLLLYFATLFSLIINAGLGIKIAEANVGTINFGNIPGVQLWLIYGMIIISFVFLTLHLLIKGMEWTFGIKIGRKENEDGFAPK